MPHPETDSARGAGAERRLAERTEASNLVAVRVSPDRDGAACAGKLQDISAGGVGVVLDRAIRTGDTFLVQPFRLTGAPVVSLLYRAVRCEPRGAKFLVGGVLISVAGDVERDPAGRIAPADLERLRRAVIAA